MESEVDVKIRSSNKKTLSVTIPKATVEKLGLRAGQIITIKIREENK